jgi:Ca2+-transporting ATPase
MKRPPRPKTQPVVMGWMWRGIVANALILTVCIFCTYLLALWAYAGAFFSEDITDITRTHCAIWDHSGGFHTPHVKIDCGLWTACSNITGADDYHTDCAAWEMQSEYAAADEKAIADKVVSQNFADGAIYTPHGNQECEVCIDTSIRRARTCAFIALVWAENFRAYSSRSFENGVWVGMFSNPHMNKAIIMAQASLYMALWLPGLNEDVLGLYVSEIHGFGWAIALGGAFACLVFCELYKFGVKSFDSQL